MLWKTIIIILLSLLILLFLLKKHNETYINTTQKIRKNISEKIYGKNFSQCKSIITSSSYGLLADASIVCKATENLSATPIFYYEEFPNDFTVNGWFFVNLDITDFSILYKKSPQFILCKTRQTYNILSQQFPTKNILYTGFTSFDKYNSSIEKSYKSFIHIAGKSPFKGTNILLKTWLHHPEWPTLTIVAREYPQEVCTQIINMINIKPKNIIFIFDFLTEEKLEQLSNENGIHICCSEHEGFGHYLHEAKSMASVVLYTNAPPMNETFIDGYNGISIHSNFKHIRNDICPVYNVSQQDIEQSVNKVIKMSIEELKNIGNLARQSFLEEKEKFQTNLTSAIIGHNRIPKIIHNIWISKENQYEDVEIPKKYEKYVQSWKEHNTNFQFMYWSGRKIINLFENHLPEFLDFYKNLTLIGKCDFARFAIIHIYGGLYTDIDFICRNNIENLLQGESYFIFEPIEHWRKVNSKLVCNGFFALYPKSSLSYDFLTYITKQKAKGVLESTGPIALYNYLKNTPYKVLYGNTCDVISNNNKTYAPQCNGEYNNYTTTIWSDGSGWGSNYNQINTDNLTINTINNPIDNNQIRINVKNKFDSKNIILKYNNFLTEKPILLDPYEAIFIAHTLKNNNSKENVYFYNDDVDTCNFVENTALINSIPNIKISHKEKWYNFLDGTKLVWEVSDFTQTNWPDLMYEIQEKRQIFEMCKNLKYKHGIIDVGAHIGDLAIPLAKALSNHGRSDIIVYAIDPSKNKCDFMRKMAKYNDINNIVIIEAGISDTDKKLAISNEINGNNTGMYKWNSKNGEMSIFTTVDKLMENGIIGHIGFYHIDVEGHEIDVLKGSKNLIRKYKPIITMEVFTKNENNTEETQKCQDYNSSPYCKKVFDILAEIDNSYTLSGYLPNKDLIFTTNE